MEFRNESSSEAGVVDISEDENANKSRPASSRRQPRVRIKKTEENEMVETTEKAAKWSKYIKRYKPQWEKLEVFANWLHRSPENLIMMGKPEAYCLFCQQCLRAHKSDLLAHAKSKKHKEAENNNSAAPRDCRSFIESYVPDSDDQAKNEPTHEARNSSSHKRSRGRPSQQPANKEAIYEQIGAEMEETDEKIKVCEEELNNLRIKKARLEFEFEYYTNH